MESEKSVNNYNTNDIGDASDYETSNSLCQLFFYFACFASILQVLS